MNQNKNWAFMRLSWGQEKNDKLLRGRKKSSKPREAQSEVLIAAIILRPSLDHFWCSCFVLRCPIPVPLTQPSAVTTGTQSGTRTILDSCKPLREMLQGQRRWKWWNPVFHGMKWNDALPSSLSEVEPKEQWALSGVSLYLTKLYWWHFVQIMYMWESYFLYLKPTDLG